MYPRHSIRGLAALVATATIVGLSAFLYSGTASAATGSAAALAAANVGKSAGTCADIPTHNSLGGTEFSGSCTGADGGNTYGPEFWCADFVRWDWANSGFYTGGLSAAAGSFYVYGEHNGTLHTSASYQARPGDAVVFDYSGGGVAAHVGIVTAVNADGSVVTANGDWAGRSGVGEAGWATSSSVVSLTFPASQASAGDYASAAHYYISAYVTPVASGTGNNPPPVDAGNPYSPNAVCGTGFGVIDSHDLGGATAYLLYDDATGYNCVTTLVATPGSAVALKSTLAVQGGSSGADSGSYTYYAGPVKEHAPGSCVQWGGAYKTTTWTSGWTHCGGGAGAAPPQGTNIYTAQQVCGAGYGVIDDHALTGATVYLLYDNDNGDNCVATLATNPSTAKATSATLSVQGGSTATDSGSYKYYAGPVTEHAPNSCVQWGGSYNGSSWTSSWSHCGTGTSNPTSGSNPYSPAAVCGSGYAVIDKHDLGSATSYLLYDTATGYNCVVTLADNPAGATAMKAVLSVQGGSTHTDSGSYTYYAGPVSAYAPSTCVEWGGAYQSASWTSAWSHCG